MSSEGWNSEWTRPPWNRLGLDDALDWCSGYMLTGSVFMWGIRGSNWCWGILMSSLNWYLSQVWSLVGERWGFGWACSLLHRVEAPPCWALCELELLGYSWRPEIKGIHGGSQGEVQPGGLHMESSGAGTGWEPSRLPSQVTPFCLALFIFIFQSSRNRVKEC